MNEYILNDITNNSVDEERLKILNYTPNLFRNFLSILKEIKSPKDGGFMFIKTKKDYDWNYGLYCASSGGHLNLVNLMISKGANDWNKGLLSACYGGNQNVVDLIISKGGNNWNSGLYGACWRSNQNLVNLMILKGADYCFYCRKSMEEHLKRT